jgi:hypothetical protein
VTGDEQAAREWRASVYLEQGTAAVTHLTLAFQAAIDEAYNVTVTWATREVTGDGGVISWDENGVLRLEFTKRANIVSDKTGVSWLLQPAGPSPNTGTVYASMPQLESVGLDYAQFYKRTGNNPLNWTPTRAQIAEEILYSAGYEPQDLELLSWAAFDEANPELAGLHMHDDVKKSQTVERAIAPNGMLVDSRRGLLRLLDSTLNPRDDLDSDAPRLLEGDCSENWDLEPVKPAWRVRIGYLPVENPLNTGQVLGAAEAQLTGLLTQPYRFVEAVDRGAAKIAGARDITYHSQIVVEADAIALAERMLMFHRQPRAIVALKPQALIRDAMDRVYFSSQRYGLHNAGTFLFADGSVVQYDDNADVEKANPDEGTPGLVVKFADNPGSERVRSEMSLLI